MTLWGAINYSIFLMFSASIFQIKTRDEVTLDGIFIKPNRKSSRAVLFTHGLGGNFYGWFRVFSILSEATTKEGVTFASFNNRGHDAVSKIKNGKKRTLAGAGFENFKESVYDIEAQIHFLRQQGIREIYLVGHSTGANKALYYMYQTRDRRVRGLALLGPLSDFVGEKMALGKKYNSLLREIKTITENKNKSSLPLSPEIFTRRGLAPRIMSAKRYLSLYSAGSPEDVFPYSDPKARWKELRSVKIPLLVVIGEKDQYLDRKAKDLTDTFAKNAISAKSFAGIVIKNADHGFYKKEKELAKTIVDWIKKTSE